MLTFLVETNKEYTSHLTNIVTPLIFEGLQSVYKDAMKTANENDVLKVFQSYLRQIPKWNQEMLEREVERIINSSQSYAWLNDLIKATLKSNLIILLYNPTCKKQAKIDPSYYKDIKTTNFIHKVYIECARELWNNPYLLYHNYPPLEIKRNQRDCMCIIKDCIKEAIRKLLPVKHILQLYLGEEIELNNIDQEVEIDKVMSEADKTKLKKIVDQDLAKNEELENFNISPKQIGFKQTHDMPHNMPHNMPHMIGGKMVQQTSNSEEKTIGSKILNIINKNSENFSDMKSDKFSGTSSDSTSLEVPTSKLLDDKLKSILKKDLGTDSDIETSLNYSQEDNNDKYQEIFSNSNKEQEQKHVQVQDKQKKKFFNNYLQF